MLCQGCVFSTVIGDSSVKTCAPSGCFIPHSGYTTAAVHILQVFVWVYHLYFFKQLHNIIFCILLQRTVHKISEVESTDRVEMKARGDI